MSEYKLDQKEFANKVKETGRAHSEAMKDAVADLKENPQSTDYATIDLISLFQVPTPPNNEDLEAWYKQMGPALNKRSKTPAGRSVRMLFDTLDDVLPGNGLRNPGFWAKLDSLREDAVRKQLNDAMKVIVSELPLKAATMDFMGDRLEFLIGQSPTPQTIAAAAEQNGIQIVQPFPIDVAMPPAFKIPWSNANKHSDFPTMLHPLVLGQGLRVQDASVIDKLSIGTTAIGVANISKAHTASKQQDSDELQAAQKLLLAMSINNFTEAKLHQLVLSATLASVATELGKRRPVMEIRDGLINDGLSKAEATRLVTVANEKNIAAPVSTGPSAPQVRDAIAEGDLDAAQRYLNALPDDAEDLAAVQDLVSKTVGEKRDALEEYERAYKSKDYAAAASALQRAQLVDSQDESLEIKKQQLPPMPVTRVVARPDEAGRVIVTWSCAEDLSYEVYRSVERPARYPGDGTLIKINKDRAVDSSAPQAKPLVYTVFACRDGNVYSEPASSAPIEVILPPQDFNVEAAETSLSASWKRPADASATQVVLTAIGTSAQTRTLGNESSTIFDDLTSGNTYQIAVSAIYMVDGQEKRSPKVSRSATPRTTATPVSDLVVEQGSAAGQVSVSWTGTPGFETHIWWLPQSADIPEHDTVKPGFFDNSGGKRLTPISSSTDPNYASRMTATVAAPNGIGRLVPVVIVDDGLLVGTSILAGSAPQVQHAEARAFGNDVKVGVEFPDGDIDLEISWSANGERRKARVSRVDYRARGILIPDANNMTDIQIVSLVNLGTETLRSAPMSVNYTPRVVAAQVAYSLSLKKGFMGRRYNAFLELRSTPGTQADLVLVQGLRDILPMRAEDGFIKDTFSVTFDASGIFRRETELGKLDSPFILKLFTSTPGVTVIDPPVQQLKG